MKTESPRINVARLLREPGLRIEVEAELATDGHRMATTQITPDAQMRAKLALEAITTLEITVTGEVTAPYEGECRRCLEPVTGEVTATLREVYATRPDDPEVYALDGDVLDLTPMLRDAVLLEVPMAPLCGPECEGPVPEAFEADFAEDLAEEGGADAPKADDRWAGLSALVFDDEVGDAGSV